MGLFDFELINRVCEVLGCAFTVCVHNSMTECKISGISNTLAIKDDLLLVGRPRASVLPVWARRVETQSVG
jgi:hypothetical protein